VTYKPTGRLINFNQTTLSIGYHVEWERHGVILEIPITNQEVREPYRIRRYRMGELILP